MQRYTTRPDQNDLFTPLPIYFLFLSFYSSNSRSIATWQVNIYTDRARVGNPAMSRVCARRDVDEATPDDSDWLACLCTSEKTLTVCMHGSCSTLLNFSPLALPRRKTESSLTLRCRRSCWSGEEGARELCSS